MRMRMYLGDVFNTLAAKSKIEEAFVDLLAHIYC